MLFLLPAESVHYFSMNLLKLACSIPVIRKMITGLFKPGAFNPPGEIFGLNFENKVGLGAGFDKNARWLTELETLGFGFVEIGTVTPQPQEGNKKPRLFRLPEDGALINRMGFNNDGVKKITQRLKQWKEKNSRLIIGGNIGKNKHTPNDSAYKDYETCFRELFEYVDYFVVNVSSPNTPGLRELQEKDALRKIVSHLQILNAQQVNPKPILLKIAPDLSTEQLDDVIDLSLKVKLDGLVATNTTTSRNGLIARDGLLQAIGNGGLSGRPLKERSTQIVRYISQKSNGLIPVIASGGIFSAGDALEKINAGACLVQVWTGFIYEGPGIVKRISALLAEDMHT